MTKINDIPFSQAQDVTSISVRLAPIDVGFDLVTGGYEIELPDDPTLRVSYADADGDHRVMEGPRDLVIQRLSQVGYRIFTQKEPFA